MEKSPSRMDDEDPVSFLLRVAASSSSVCILTKGSCVGCPSGSGGDQVSRSPGLLPWFCWSPRQRPWSHTSNHTGYNRKESDEMIFKIPLTWHSEDFLAINLKLPGCITDTWKFIVSKWILSFSLKLSQYAWFIYFSLWHHVVPLSCHLIYHLGILALGHLAVTNSLQESKTLS